MKNNIFKNSVILIGLLIITKLSGFVKEMLVAQFYGASNITDAYNVVVSMSSILFEGFTVAICMAYISVITKERDNEKKFLEVTSGVMTLLWIVVFILSILSTIFAKYICKLFAVGFDNETMNMTISMARIVLPIASLFVIKGILGGYLQVRGSFWYTGIGTFVMNLILIVSIISSHNNIYILAGGYVLATVCVTILGVINAKIQKFRFIFKLKVKDDLLKNILRLALPIFVAQSITDLNLLIDRNFASVLGSGMISIFNYANKLNVLFIAIFAQAFSTVIFPEFAKAAKDKAKKETFNILLNKAIKIAVYVMIPIAAFVFFAADQIVDIAFFRGAFTKENVFITGNILQIYALTMPFMSAVEIYTKGFYALENTKKPMIYSFISLVINIVGNWELIRLFGYRGLAAATLLSVVIQIILLARNYKVLYSQNKQTGVMTHAIKCVCAVIPFAGLMVINHCIYSIKANILVKLTIIGIEFVVSSLVYVLLTNIMGMPYLSRIKSMLKKRNRSIKDE